MPGWRARQWRGLGARLLTDLPTPSNKTLAAHRSNGQTSVDRHTPPRSISLARTRKTAHAHDSLIATSCAFMPLRTSSLNASRKVPIVTRNAFSTSSIIDAVAKCI